MVFFENVSFRKFYFHGHTYIFIISNWYVVKIIPTKYGEFSKHYWHSCVQNIISVTKTTTIKIAVMVSTSSAHLTLGKLLYEQTFPDFYVVFVAWPVSPNHFEVLHLPFMLHCCDVTFNWNWHLFVFRSPSSKRLLFKVFTPTNVAMTVCLPNIGAVAGSTRIFVYDKRLKLRW